MQTLDIFDAETGCYNENYFIHRLKQEKRRMERSESALTMIIFDFSEHAKKLNGNSRLSEIGACICKNVRASDIKARLQDNKIVLLLSDTKTDKAFVVADKLTNRLENIFSDKEISIRYRIKTYPDLQIQKTEELSAGTQQATGAIPQSPMQSYFKMSWPSVNLSAAVTMEEFNFLSDITSKVKQFQWQLIAKRAIDIIGSLVGLLILSPIILAVAIAIKLTSPGPVLFRQERLGYMGKSFIFLKFRSMSDKCDDSSHRDYMEKFIKKDNESSNKSSFYKMTGDPRITPLGQILRKTSLDEIPQLINVLLGEMSLVGPRPPIAYEVDKYSSWHKRRILEVMPGITGLWQVEGRSLLPFDEMVRLDIQYTENWSFWLDLKIILKTFRVLFSGKGAC